MERGADGIGDNEKTYVGVEGCGLENGRMRSGRRERDARNGINDKRTADRRSLDPRSSDLRPHTLGIGHGLVNLLQRLARSLNCAVVFCLYCQRWSCLHGWCLRACVAVSIHLILDGWTDVGSSVARNRNHFGAYIHELRSDRAG